MISNAERRANYLKCAEVLRLVAAAMKDEPLGRDALEVAREYEMAAMALAKPKPVSLS